MPTIALLTRLLLLLFVPLMAADCIPNTTSTSDLQSSLQSGGAGYILQLCQGQTYNLSATLSFQHAQQEISTQNYPIDESRALLYVDGFNVSTAIEGNKAGLDGCILRNVQIDGNRDYSMFSEDQSALIEMGGENANQTIEFSRIYEPRGFSCLHIAEGPFACINTTIQNNEIGPCGSPIFQTWADGISLSCQASLVQNNVITDATDGGIVVFGAPFSTVRNNTVQVKTRTTLGGINLVDVLPWPPEGNYSHTLVEDNFINGGFATSYGNSTMGMNNASAIIKIGIGIGPRVWFGSEYGTNASMGGTVQGNVLSGAFAFGMAVSSAQNFVVQNNSFTGNTSFTASFDPNCTATGPVFQHAPVPLLVEMSTISNVTLSGPPSSSSLDTSFVNGSASGLTCFTPMGTDQIAWPYGGGQVDSSGSTNGAGAGAPLGSASSPSGPTSSGSTTPGKSGAAHRAGLDWSGVIVGGAVACLAVWRGSIGF